MKSRILKVLPVFLFCLSLLPEVHAQLGKITFDLDKDKPDKFKDKTLKSEKTGEKKFTVPRRFIQNTVSHYNYYFNANNKINQVIERARLGNRNDYTKLLPFYSYSLENTANQKRDLDSVIYKATAGILIHDLRSNWVDNLYLLIGEAYYFRKAFDSASMTFQFINYNLFPRKKKDEDDQLIVGSNENEINKSVSIASKEDRNLIDKAFTRPPSRNDALIWQIRTLIDMGEWGDAAGLINTLQNDPYFPDRLKPSLEEMKAYWFYNQQMYDSILVHLVNSLPTSIDIEDRARREFLIAQLYELTNDQPLASVFYDRAIKHTTDPLMDIYANLDKAKMLKSRNPAEIDKSIATLLRMARKDKFEAYRDIIYFSAAQLAMIKPDTTSAISFFRSSTKYNQENIPIKNKAFLTLAEISYRRKKYMDAYNNYDSIQAGDTSLGDMAQIIQRKKALAAIVGQINIINREDSLQTIAGMSQAERDDFIKKLSKRLIKEKGIKEEDSVYATQSNNFFKNQNASGGLYGNKGASGSWYFYDNAMKGSGYNEFKQNWGRRQNADNWRRASPNNSTASTTPSATTDSSGILSSTDQNADPLISGAAVPVSIPVQKDLSEKGLLANVPLTKAKMDISDSRLSKSLFQLGKDYQNLLEDYQAAIETYEHSLSHFPDSLYAGELYLNLSYCYRKLGNLVKADYYKDLLVRKFAKSKFTQLALHPETMDPSKKDTAATARYEDIYTLFIEGNFQKAVDEKKIADSTYGPNYWSPQLLYIESVYYIKKREDSTAIKVLNEIITLYPKSPLRSKAVTMMDVLKRRKSIENYLTDLKVVREKEDTQLVVYDDPTIIRRISTDSVKKILVRNDSNLISPVMKKIEPLIKPVPVVTNGTFSFDSYEPQFVMVILAKVDPVYTSEAKNAFTRYNRENFYAQNIEITKDTLDSVRTLLIFAPFDNADAALKYMNRLKRDAPAEISWLPANKYSFYIISNPNLALLKENKNLQGYLDLLNKKYPGKF
jgi:tetratricopeptide (TPR) repeat protein